MKARKKPIEIECFQGDREYYVPDWAIEEHKKLIMYFACTVESPYELFINTLEGTQHVSVGDYVIKGVHGELYPCKPDIFEQTYEIVED